MADTTPPPPGTVPLMQHEDTVGAMEFLLSPTPSSDPNEPLNWPTWRKVLNYGLVTVVTLAAFTNLSVQTLAGLAVGCLFFIPFAIKYGRRPVYLLSTLILAASSWWTSRVDSYAELIATSFITGLAGAINETAVQMTISDLFFVHQRGAANGVYFIAVMCGSFLTPMGAGAQAVAQSWRWSYYSISIALTVLFVVFVTAVIDFNDLELPIEGYSQEQNEVKKMNSVDLAAIKSNAVGEVNIPMKSYRERHRLVTKSNESLWKTFISPVRVICLPHVAFTAIQFASGVCWLVTMLQANAIVFSAPPYLFTPAGVGYMALGPFVGNVFGSMYGGVFADWLVVRLARRNNGIYEPEMRLYPLFLSTITMAGGMIMYGTTAARGMHWVYPSIGGAFFAFGLGSNGGIAFTLVIDAYRELTAESFVGIAFIRNAGAIGVPSAFVPWMTSMGLSNMFITAGCVAFAVGSLFLPLLIWGKKIRIALAPRFRRLVELHEKNK
ncbi:putative MFS-type transporter like protein [Verticillium longisporum]|nr:putative MFS-type transporter like protein [Verticillium longisporum]